MSPVRVESMLGELLEARCGGREPSVGELLTLVPRRGASVGTLLPLIPSGVALTALTALSCRIGAPASGTSTRTGGFCTIPSGFGAVGSGHGAIEHRLATFEGRRRPRELGVGAFAPGPLARRAAVGFRWDG